MGCDIAENYVTCAGTVIRQDSNMLLRDIIESEIKRVLRKGDMEDEMERPACKYQGIVDVTCEEKQWDNSSARHTNWRHS